MGFLKELSNMWKDAGMDTDAKRVLVTTFAAVEEDGVLVTRPKETADMLVTAGLANAPMVFDRRSGVVLHKVTLAAFSLHNGIKAAIGAGVYSNDVAGFILALKYIRQMTRMPLFAQNVQLHETDNDILAFVFESLENLTSVLEQDQPEFSAKLKVKRSGSFTAF